MNRKGSEKGGAVKGKPTVALPAAPARRPRYL